MDAGKIAAFSEPEELLESCDGFRELCGSARPNGANTSEIG